MHQIDSCDLSGHFLGRCGSLSTLFVCRFLEGCLLEAFSLVMYSAAPPVSTIITWLVPRAFKEEKIFSFEFVSNKQLLPCARWGTRSVIYGGWDGDKTSCFFVCDRFDENLSVSTSSSFLQVRPHASMLCLQMILRAFFCLCVLVTSLPNLTRLAPIESCPKMDTYLVLR